MGWFCHNWVYSSLDEAVEQNFNSARFTEALKVDTVRKAGKLTVLIHKKNGSKSVIPYLVEMDKKGTLMEKDLGVIDGLLESFPKFKEYVKSIAANDPDDEVRLYHQKKLREYQERLQTKKAVQKVIKNYFDKLPENTLLKDIPHASIGECLFKYREKNGHFIGEANGTLYRFSKDSAAGLAARDFAEKLYQKLLKEGFASEIKQLFREGETNNRMRICAEFIARECPEYIPDSGDYLLLYQFHDLLKNRFASL